MEDPISLFPWMNCLGSETNERTLQKIATKIRHVSIEFVHHDCGDVDFMSDLLQKHRIDLVMHFAGYTYVSESVLLPLRYVDSIVTKTKNLLEAMEGAGVTRLIYSSSSAVYGQTGQAGQAGQTSPSRVPAKVLIEESGTAPLSPYGEAKWMAERVITAFAVSQRSQNKSFSYTLLRYFNVIGSDPQIRIGPHAGASGASDASGTLANFTRIVDSCLDAALSGRSITIFGNDFPTMDGTAVRDYIDVSDVVAAHRLVLLRMLIRNNDSVLFNVANGRGYSNLQVIEACRQVSGSNIDIVFAPRKEGDPASAVANISRIQTQLAWIPRSFNLVQTISTAWRWRLVLLQRRKCLRMKHLHSRERGC